MDLIEVFVAWLTSWKAYVAFLFLCTKTCRHKLCVSKRLCQVYEHRRLNQNSRKDRFVKRNEGHLSCRQAGDVHFAEARRRDRGFRCCFGLFLENNWFREQFLFSFTVCCTVLYFCCVRGKRFVKKEFSSSRCWPRKMQIVFRRWEVCPC